MQTGSTYRRGRTYVYRNGNHSGKDGTNCFLIFLGCVFFVAIPFFNISNEAKLYQSEELSKEVEMKVIDISKASKVDEMVHLQGVEYESYVADPSFAVNLDHGINLHRKTEYCQWNQVTDSKTHTKCNSKGEDCESYTTTTYHYIKGWQPHLTNSLFFDQPAAHHNPQRDPFPSQKFPSTNMLTVNKHSHQHHDPASPQSDSLPICSIDSSVLENAFATYRPVDFTLGAKPHLSYWTKLWRRMFGDPSIETRYEDIHSLQGTQNSRAAQSDGFYYVGQGGYFFSPYQSDQITFLAKAFFGYLEGSLFDWQFGDLMPSCTAGDIRVKYYVQDPTEISVLGITNEKSNFVETSSTPKKISIGSTLSSQPDVRKLGFVQEGSVTSSAMMETVVLGMWYMVVFTRVLLLPWSYFVSRMLGTFFGYELRSGHGTPLPTPISTSVLAVLGTWSLVVAFCEFVIRARQGSSVYSGLNQRVILFTVISLIGAIFVDRNAARLFENDEIGLEGVKNLFRNKPSKARKAEPQVYEEEEEPEREEFLKKPGKKVD